MVLVVARVRSMRLGRRPGARTRRRSERCRRARRQRHRISGRSKWQLSVPRSESRRAVRCQRLVSDQIPRRLFPPERRALRGAVLRDVWRTRRHVVDLGAWPIVSAADSSRRCGQRRCWLSAVDAHALKDTKTVQLSSAHCDLCAVSSPRVLGVDSEDRGFVARIRAESPRAIQLLPLRCVLVNSSARALVP